jgi:hypothetical protein
MALSLSCADAVDELSDQAGRADLIPCACPPESPAARPASWQSTGRPAAGRGRASPCDRESTGRAPPFVPILVIGVLNETGVQSVPQNVYFSVFKIDQRVA